MGINWKLRFKNKATLVALLSAVLLFVKQVSEMFGVDLSSQLEQVSGIAGTIFAILVSLGVIVDPTSKGVSDSGIAQTYDNPRDSSKKEEQVDWESNQYSPEEWVDNKQSEVSETVEGLRGIEDEKFPTIRRNFDSDINNSGVMLDTSQQVEGGVVPDENTVSNQ